MDKAITALVGALIGVIAIWGGMRFHIGSWYVDGSWAYVASAVTLALVALVVRWTLRKQFGWH
jgi:hypothetical protein